MKYEIDPGKEQASLTLIDNIVYSHVTDLDGNPLDLHLSILTSLSKGELMAAKTGKISLEGRKKSPVVLWFNGGAWRGVDKNMQIGDLAYIAKNGFTLVCAYYRSTSEGHEPDQYIDCKTAVRFLRANADLYSLDPDRIAVMGRSAGGHLTAELAMNDGKYISEEYKDYSSDVQCAWDLFGPVDLYYMHERNMDRFEKKIPGRDGKPMSLDMAAEAKLLGTKPGAETLAKAKEFSPYYNITDTMCPTIIMHGDSDRVVPCEVSLRFYDALCKAGKEEQTDLYILKGADHGTPEFFQTHTIDIALNFFRKWMK